MTQDIIIAMLAAILSGGAGYMLAIVKRDTSLAILRRDVDEHKKLIHDQGERIDRHLKIIFRLILDIARHSGVNIRTADAVEIATLTDGDLGISPKRGDSNG